VVVWPLRGSPTRPRLSPSWSVKLTPSTARTTRVPPQVKKWVCRPDTLRTGSRRAPASPRVMSRPDRGAPDRGAPRLRRGAPNAGGYGGPSRGPPSSQIPRLRIEPDAQPVAEELRGENDQENAQPGEHREPPLARHQGGTRLREHEPPGRLRRRHADAEKAQRRFRDDDDADRETGQHRRRVHDVRQDVPLDHAQLA